MATVIRKTVFVFVDVWHIFSTSRRAQWTTVCALLALLIIGNLWHQYRKHRTAEQQSEEVQKNRELQEATATKQLTESLFNFPSNSVSGVALGVGAGSGGSDVPALVRSEIQGLVPALLPDVLLPDFYAKGYFDRVYAGDRRCLQTAGYFAHARGLLIVVPRISYKDSTVGDGMVSCFADLDCRLIPSLSGFSQESTIHLTGLGSTEDLSLRDAIGKLSEHKAELEALLK